MVWRSVMFNKIILASFFTIFCFTLQSCGASQMGQELSKTFDLPQGIGAREVLPDKDKSDDTYLIKNSSNKKIPTKEVKLKEINNESKIEVKKTIFNPQPYRITIKLSGANPSAPAEIVTEALRNAGVRFEVEKIERFDGGDLSKDRSLKR